MSFSSTRCELRKASCTASVRCLLAVWIVCDKYNKSWWIFKLEYRLNIPLEKFDNEENPCTCIHVNRVYCPVPNPVGVDLPFRRPWTPPPRFLWLVSLTPPPLKNNCIRPCCFLKNYQKDFDQSCNLGSYEH